MKWYLVVLVVFLCLTELIRSHGDEEEGRNRHRGDHHHGRKHHRCSPGHERKPDSNSSTSDLQHGGGSVKKDVAEPVTDEVEQEIDPKFLSIQLCPRARSQTEAQKLLVFNVERYGNWSDWSKCLVKDCIEVRYRTCLDDSWEKPSPNPVRTTKCLSKYYVEKRTCSNKTACSAPVAFENCGIRPKASNVAPKIIGGDPTTPNSWPWAVRLSIKFPKRKAVTFCGGTLIAPQWIMTAAHCLLVENRRLPVGEMISLADHMLGNVYAHLGDHHKEDTEETQQDYRVSKAILHPRYHRKLMTDGDDIALLYLSEPVKITPEVNYACLPNKELQLEPGTKCYAVGWGNSKPGRTPTFDDIQSILQSFFTPFPDIFSHEFPFSRPVFPFRHLRRRRREEPDSSTAELHEVELPVVSIDRCRKYYTDLNDELHLCAGAKGKDTCSGDSGGGLYCQLPKSDKWFITGVTSFGLARGCGRNPGIYTAVSPHMDWVTKAMSEPVF